MQNKNFKKVGLCNFIKKTGHYKKVCFVLKAWLKKKTRNRGKSIALLCLESHLIVVPLNSLWIDHGSSTHIIIPYSKSENGNPTGMRLACS